MAFRPDKYVDLDLILIRYIKTFAMHTSGVIRHIKDDINVLE